MGLVMDASGYQKNLFLRSTRPKSRTTVEVEIHTSAPSCHDGLAWPCTGALYPCICRQPAEKHQRLRAWWVRCSKRKCDIESNGSACPQHSRAL